jgi:hypothetical protein
MKRLSRMLPHAAAIALFVLLATLIPSCDSVEGDLKPNQPPDVWVASGPPEGGETSYIVHFFWNGWDKDGDVLYFEFAITDNENGAFDPADTTGRDKWHKTTAYDSVFAFSADELADTSSTELPAKFTRSHTFFVRAVDNKGLASTRPAYRSFTARTLSPTVDITFPATDYAQLPPITTLHWTATDYIDNIDSKQDPDSIRWILVNSSDFSDDTDAALAYIRDNPDAPQWYPWIDYNAPMDEGKKWTTPPLDQGIYVFAVQALDEAGAVTPVFDGERNVRIIRITTEGTGPLIKLCNDYMPCLLSSILNPALTLVDWPSGLPITFAFTLTGFFPSETMFYRYGWDVTNFDEDEQWSTDWVLYQGGTVATFEQTWYYGVHTFYVEAKNESGFISRLGVKFNMFPFTMERDLLLVDDYYEEPLTCGVVKTNGAVPCDDEHDAFWEDVLQNVEGFNPLIDFVEVSRTALLPIEKLAQYKTVIWNVRGGYNLLESQLPMLYDWIGYVSKHHAQPPASPLHTNPLAQYMAVGGHVLICGEQPITMVIPKSEIFLIRPKFPFIFKYELDGDQDGNYTDDPPGIHSFAYREMCLDVLDIAYTDANSLRKPGENGCGVTDVRTVDPQGDGLRECDPIDTNFPALALRPEVSDPGKFYAPDSRGLNCELYNPQYFSCFQLPLDPRECFEPIYGHGCIDGTSVIYSAPVAAWTSAFAHVVPDVAAGVAVAARSAVWGFEPYYFEPTSVRQALEVILFDEWMLPRK